jgi:carboxymethylenebutenolidase
VHGETISFPVGGRGLPAYAARPAGARRGAVVLHEILGRQPEIDRVVERFARSGYAAVAPDLYADGPTLACVRRLMLASATGEGRPVEVVRAARRWLCETTGLPEGSVGLIGLCLTGGLVLAMGHGWGAVSTNYGAPPRPARLAGLPPVIACYGGRDRLFAHFAPRLEKNLAAAGVPAEVHTFPTVGHSFLTDGDHPVAAFLGRPLFQIRYDPAVAEEAWSRIFAFLERHLPEGRA